MKTKNYMFAIATIFALVLALGLVSATLTITPVNTPSTVNDVDGTFQITFNLTNNDLAINPLITSATTISAVTAPSGLAITPSISFSPTNIADGTISQVTILVTATVNYANSYAGTISGTINVSDSTGSFYDTLSFSVSILDTTAPVIATVSNVEIGVGDSYSDTLPPATDNYDASIIVVPVITDSSGFIVQESVIGLIEEVYTYTYTATDSNGVSATPVTRVVTVTQSFCTLGSNSTGLELSKFDITNNGRGDDNKWYPLDTIEIEVEFENSLGQDNNGDDIDLDDVIFELGIFDSNGKNVVGDMIWLSEDEEEFEAGDVDESKDIDHTFIFRINPAEFDIDEDYEVKVKAYPAGEESTTCIGFSSDMKSFGSSKYFADVSIKMAKDENSVIVDKENFPIPATAQCEQEVTFTADIWNTGDQDWEDQILITLYNSELGIDQNVTITGDLDQGDMVQVTFTFDVPADMVEKTYDLSMLTFYDWDVDDSEYDEFSKETFVFPLKVEGNCAVPEVAMTASLESGGKAGQTLVVRATVTNTGTEDTTYTFSVTGSSSWASSVSINNTLTLAAGQSGDILVSFEVDKKAEGDQTFSIETYAEGELLLTQPVQVAIEGRSGLGFKGDNGAIAILIALISAIAIAIIIVLIVRASKRKEAD